MNMNNKEYWEKRQSLNYLSGEKTADELLISMKQVYKNSLKEINKEIEAFYGRYAENNNLTLQEVNKRLNSKELKSVKEELKKYYDMADPSKIGKNMSSEYRQELRLQSAKSYMSRLEALKSDLKNITVNLGAEENKAFYQTLEKIYGDTYKKTNFEIDKFRGYSTGFTELNYKKLNTAIHQKWLGMNFSDRIWQNKGKLLDSINTTFLQGIAQGKNPNKIAIDMNEKLKTGLYNCQRLARTESAHIINEATLQGYKDRGISKQYQFVATLDDRTSDVCQELDGKVFDIKSAEPGLNYPPMHPNCRSTTIPYFETDEIDNMFDEAQRIARNENGELYYVPASMNYKQWKDMFVSKTETPIDMPILIDDEKCLKRKHMEDFGVESIDFGILKNNLSEEQIIERLGGQDKTSGSCASVACAYVANKYLHLDVLDFRGGYSQSIIANGFTRKDLSTFKGVVSYSASESSDLLSVQKVFKQMKPDKEYILTTGGHASIVRIKNGDYEYLELQSANNTSYKNGWHSFEHNDENWYKGGMKRVIQKRFGGTIRGSKYSNYRSTILIELDSIKSKEFYEMIKYINTKENMQMKGVGGGIK